MAVYTEVTAEELALMLRRYEIGELVALKGIAEGVENSNFFIRTTEGPYFLTLYERRVSRSDLPFFLGLMEHLSAEGVICPTPVHDRDGRVLQTLAGRPAAIVTFLPGYSIRKPQPVHCEAMARMLARIHTAGKTFTVRRENALSLRGWEGLSASLGRRADELCEGLTVGIREHLRDLSREWPRHLPSGVIHADLFPDNVLFLNDSVSGVIDFYFACNDFLAYDLAICLNAWCFEADNAFNVTKAQALMKGYTAVRDLSAAEIAALPVLARGAAMRFLLTRLYDWFNTPETAFVRRKDPLEYWRKLQFHQDVRTSSAYGI